MKAITSALVIAGILSALALVAQDERSFIEARIRKWQQAVARNPSDYETLVSIGAAYGKLGEYETSLTYFNRAIAVNPSYADAYAGLGSSYGFLGRPSEALTALKKAVSLDPRNPITQGKLGTTLGKAGRYQEAITHLKEAIRLAPNMADAHFALGLAYLSVDDRKNASIEVEVLSRLDSHQADQLQSLIERSTGR
jgi:tetratricopeptide (TPR) repeat protein